MRGSGVTADFTRLVKDVRVISVSLAEPVQVKAQPDSLRCVGLGTTAAVFQLKERPEIALKVFAPSQLKACQEEVEIYKLLGNSPYFPHFYYEGSNFFAMGYRPGTNLYDCLLQGIFIPDQVITDVDDGLAFARSKGLNPCDVHLKNIIINEGRGFLVDVSAYRRSQICRRWESLRHAYYNYYLDLYQPGLTIPSWVLEAIRTLYKATEFEHDISGFAERIRQMFF